MVNEKQAKAILDDNITETGAIYSSNLNWRPGEEIIFIKGVPWAVNFIRALGWWMENKKETP